MSDKICIFEPCIIKLFPLKFISGEEISPRTKLPLIIIEPSLLTKLFVFSSVVKIF